MKKILHVKEVILNDKDESSPTLALIVLAIYGMIFTVTYIAW